MSTTLQTLRVSRITHAQAIRLPGQDVNSVQIDGIDEDGNPVRIILEPPVLKAMLELSRARDRKPRISA